MAFHPMRTFQKNRKFWMATILLVCMVTFVLCTGFQGGDFADWLLRLLGRNRGDAVTTIDGRSVNSRDIDELKLQREIANDYMRKATQLIIREVKLRSEDAGKTRDDKAREAKLITYGTYQRVLADKLAKSRYFSGGTKLDDLLDFLLWRNQADRLGVRLTEDAVRDLVAEDLYASSVMQQVTVRFLGVRNLPDYYATMSQISRWTPQAAAYVQQEVRQTFHQANYRLILDALTDEYRVRIAKMALARSPATTNEPVAANKLLTPDKWLETYPQLRMPVSPEQMYDYYLKNRNEAEIALIPVSVERYLNKVPAPTEADLQMLFDKYRTRRYDPASEEPGFQQPEQAQVSWVSADPKSKFYTHAARTALTLQAVPPTLYNPMQPLATAATSYAAHSAALDTHLMYNYQALRFQRPEKYEMPGLATPYFALPLYKAMLQPKAETVAALLGAAAEPTSGYAAFASYQAAAYFPQAKELAPLLQYERDKRWPVGSTLVLTGAASPLMAVGMEYAVAEAPTFVRDGKANYRPGDHHYTPPRQPGFDLNYQGQPVYLPLMGPLKEEIRAKLEEKQALRWAQQTMSEVKTRLEASQGGKALKNALYELQGERGDAITVGDTKGFRNPYNIGDDPGMAPLKESYERYYTDVNMIAGLSGAGMLKADDFAQLFFGAQPFAVGNANLFTPMPWPPSVMQEPNELDKILRPRETHAQKRDLWEVKDAQLFLFWRTAARPSAPPDKLADVREEVKRAWQTIKARETQMVPQLKQVTDALMKAEKENLGLGEAIRQQVKRLGEERAVLLTNVAPLVEREVPAGDVVPKRMIKTFVPYELPRGKILYPREDTAKAVLALRELKEPLKAGDKTLDDLSKGLDALNKSLFESTKGTGKLIQILTNQPRTVFYVAVLVRPPAPVDPLGVDFNFVSALQHGLGFQGMPSNLFVQQCQNAFARDYQRELLNQMRRQAKMAPPSAEAQKRFNTEGGGQ
jgi:hypothetical protein